MPCIRPLQGFLNSDTGAFVPSAQYARNFYFGRERADDQVSINCGQCLPCRVNNARSMAVRCVHEASMYDSNCFLTLTIDDYHMDREGFNFSLDKEVMRNFMKKLRSRIDYCPSDFGLNKGDKVRVLYCGEYGGRTERPHYHALLFNCGFSDQILYKKDGSYRYYNSDLLHSIWPYGFGVISSLDYGSAAYVARYVTKKVTGPSADEHYGDRLPEFSHGSRKPGLGYSWIMDNWKDVYPRDEVKVLLKDGSFSLKPPRYYDKKLEEFNPELFAEVKEARKLAGESSIHTKTKFHLDAYAKDFRAKFKRFKRSIEV